MNEVTEAGSAVMVFGGMAGLPQTADDLVKALNTMNSTIQSGMGGKPLLRLLKSGLFVFGPNNVEVQDGSHWAMNPASLQHGWACWDEGVLLGEQMVPFNTLLPRRETLPDYGHEWRQQVSADLVCLNGEDKGVEVLYKGTSLGQRNAFKELIVAIMQQVKIDATHFVPVITIEVDSYQHKKYGVTYTPDIKVVGWVDMHGQPTSSAPAVTAVTSAPTVAAAAPPATAAVPPAQAETAAPAAAAPAAAVPPAQAETAAPAAAAPAAEVKRRRRAV
jgi:hypothetical protein